MFLDNFCEILQNTHSHSKITIIWYVLKRHKFGIQQELDKKLGEIDEVKEH